MLEGTIVILYVDSPARSAEFYAALLGRDAIEASPTFAMFVLREGTMLGLWSRHTVEPSPGGTGGMTEIGFHADSNAEVDALHERWRGNGVPIAQAPVDLDFGRTFLALDPDGHRLRVFAPA